MLTSALAILLPLLVPALALPTPEGQETRVIQWGHDSKMCLQPRVIVKGSEVIMYPCPTVIQSGLNVWEVTPKTEYGVLRVAADWCLDAGEWNDETRSTDGLHNLTIQRCNEEGRAQLFWYPTAERPFLELAGPTTSHAHAGPQRAGKCLDVTDGDTDKPLQTWTCFDGNDNQKFQFAQSAI